MDKVVAVATEIKNFERASLDAIALALSSHVLAEKFLAGAEDEDKDYRFAYQQAAAAIHPASASAVGPTIATSISHFTPRFPEHLAPPRPAAQCRMAAAPRSTTEVSFSVEFTASATTNSHVTN